MLMGTSQVRNPLSHSGNSLMSVFTTLHRYEDICLYCLSRPACRYVESYRACSDRGILGLVHISLDHSPTCLVQSFVHTSVYTLRLECAHTHTHTAWAANVLGLLPPMYVTTCIVHFAPSIKDLLKRHSPSLLPAPFPSPSQIPLLGEDTRSVL